MFRNIQSTRPNSDPIPPSGGVLQPSDIIFEGFIRMPPSDPTGGKTYWPYSMGNMTYRYVGGQLRLFISGVEGRATGHGDYNDVGDAPYEVTIPAPNLNYNLSSAATLVRNWGIGFYGLGGYPGSRRPTGNNSGAVTRQFLWDPNYNGIWYAYGDNYNVGGWSDPSVGFTVLNGDGSCTPYGPWRTIEHSQKTRGYMTYYPQDFADAYCGGRRINIGAPPTSGNANCLLGLGSMALETFNPLTRPPDIVLPPGTPTPGALGCQRIIYYDPSHPQPRPSDYKFCYWPAPGDHSVTDGITSAGSTTLKLVSTALYAQSGSFAFGAFDAYIGGATNDPLIRYTGKTSTHLTGIPPTGYGSIASTIPNGTTVQLGAYDNGRGMSGLQTGEANFNNNDLRMDLFSSLSYVRNSVVEGLVAMGQMIYNVPGYPYPTDGMPHAWYGPVNEGEGLGRCSQNHIGSAGGTGPMTDTVRAMFSIYSRANLALSAQGLINPWDVTPSTNLLDPTTLTNASAIFANINSLGYYVGNLCWVPEINKLFLINNYAASDFGPVLLQFAIRAS